MPGDCRPLECATSALVTLPTAESPKTGAVDAIECTLSIDRRVLAGTTHAATRDTAHIDTLSILYLIINILHDFITDFATL